MRQLEYGIAHDLPRSMVGDRSTPIDELEARACTTEKLFPAFPMRWSGGAAEGVDWQVLKEEQDIPLFLRNPILLQLFLEYPSFCIGDRSEKLNKPTSSRGGDWERLTPLPADILV
jgi:hypothetical protein